MSITIVVMPWCFGHVGVRCARWRSPIPATCAPLVQTFWPLTSQPPSTRVALVLMPAASEPGVGLAEQLAPDDVLVAAPGRTQRSTWSSVRVLDQREDDPAGDAVGAGA